MRDYELLKLIYNLLQDRDEFKSVSVDYGLSEKGYGAITVRTKDGDVLIVGIKQKY